MPDPNELLPATHIPADNPRAIAGGNQPPSIAHLIADEHGDFALIVTAYLEEKYRQYATQLQELQAGVANLPDIVTCSEDKEAWALTIKKARELDKKLNAFHESEKNPYWRGGTAADQYFFGMSDTLAKRSKNNRPGIVDVGLSKITDYDRRVLAEEEERRKAAARETARVAAEAAAREAAARAAAAAAELAASRARTEASRVARAEEARIANEAAAAAAVEASVTVQTAQEAHIETLARPADIMRQRHTDGLMTGMGQTKYAEVTDRSLLNKDLLWPFINIADIEKALRAWAKTTDYNVQMPGAEIGRGARSTVR